MSSQNKQINLAQYIANVPNFPKPGIQFKDISPILENHDALTYVIEKFYEFIKPLNPTVIVGVESRGFIFGTPLALVSKLPFVLARKANKLPREVNQISYSLEYGTNTLEMHKNSIKPGDRVIIVDDLLATGGTVKATEKLVEIDQGTVVGYCFVVELEELNGRDNLSAQVCSLLKY